MVISDTDTDVRYGFRFRGGHPALDLTATLAGRRKSTPAERLGRPDDLARWLVAAGLSRSPPKTSPDNLMAAIDLREAIHDLALARACGLALPGTSISILNTAAAGPAAAAVLDPSGSAHLDGDAASLLGHLARLGVGLVAGQEKGVIRRCEGDGCAILFLDVSRAGARRWCSMAGCGNRAKAAAFRRRDRQDG